MIRQRLVAGVVTATALVALAACGSDAPSSAATTKTTTTTAAPGGAAAATTVSSAAAPDDSDVDATVAGLDDEITVPELGDNVSDACRELYNKFIGASGGADGTAKLGDIFGGLRKIVPDDLKDDVDTLKNAYTGFQQAVDKAGGDPAKAMQDPEGAKAIQALDDPKIQTASDNLQKWFDAQGCDDASSDGATASTTG